MGVNSLETNNDLNVFEDGLEEDFFQTAEESEYVEKADDLIETEDNSDNEESIEEVTESESESEDAGSNENKEDLFSNENVTEEDNDEYDKPVNGVNRELLDYLTNKGFIELDENENYDDLPDEDLDDFLEYKFDKTVEKKIEGVFADLPDVVKQFNKYVINGGDPMEFISYVGNLENSNISIDTKEKQKRVVQNHLKSEGYNDDYIERQLEFLEKTGDLETIAQKYVNDLEKERSKQQEEIIKKQKEVEETRKQFMRESKRKIDTFANDNDAVGDITITRKDKRELGSYMYDQAYKLQNGNTITSMQKDLFYDIPKNETAMMQLALILRNRNEDGTFNFDNIKKQIETKITNKIKQDVRRSKNLVPNDSSQNRNYSKKSLADFFD